MGEGLQRAFAAAKATRTPVPDVRPGQVWADADSRTTGRTLRVDRIEDTKAVCVVLTNSIATQHEIDRGNRHAQDCRGRLTRISLARFRPTSTGYRLISDTED